MTLSQSFKYSVASLLLTFAFSACGTTGPKITVCLSDPASQGFQCVDKERKEFFLPYPASDNYIAIPPDDFQLLLNYCKSKE